MKRSTYYKVYRLNGVGQLQVTNHDSICNGTPWIRFRDIQAINKTSYATRSITPPPLVKFKHPLIDSRVDSSTDTGPGILFVHNWQWLSARNLRMDGCAEHTPFIQAITWLQISKLPSRDLTGCLRSPRISQKLRVRLYPRFCKNYTSASLFRPIVTCDLWITLLLPQQTSRMVNDPNNAELIRWSDAGDSFFGKHSME